MSKSSRPIFARAVGFLQQHVRQRSARAAQRRLERRSNELIVILTRPKVGSSTVWHSLQALHLDVPIYHVHFLSGDLAKAAKQPLKRGKSAARHIQYLRDAQAIHDQYFEQKKHCKVITLVRDPVSTFISSFFQGWRYDIPHLMEYDADNMTDQQIAELTELMFQKRDKFLDRWETWFDAEIKAIFGIDVFASPFNREAGYQIYHAERTDLLLMTLESLNLSHKAAFRDFMQIPDFQLMPLNVGANKRYNTIYKEFTRRVALPNDFLDAAYNLPHVKHFYADEEIEAFRRKWGRSAS